jgi:glycosyltransferase involved in cell wall biosynthesis
MPAPSDRLPVSVVIPVYNRLDLLLAAVKSAQQQEAPPAEIVVVDDGSPEGSAEAALAAAGAALTAPARLRVERQENGGPSRARNRGVLLAGNPWVAFLDADDVWEPDKLRLQWAAARAHPQAVVVTSDWRRPGVPRPQGAVPRPRLEADALRRVAWLNRFQTSTALVRRDVLLDAGLFAPAMDGLEDWDMWLRVVARGAWVHIPYPLVSYADTPGGVSKDTRRAYHVGLDRLEAYRAGRVDARAAAAVNDRLLLWHHIRFAFAFHRVGDVEMRGACLRAAWRPGARLRCLELTTRGLLPFLAGRVRARLRGAPAGQPAGAGNGR